MGTSKKYNGLPKSQTWESMDPQSEIPKENPGKLLNLNFAK